MKQKIMEMPKKSTSAQPDLAKMAENIRTKKRQGLTLSKEEQEFFDNQREENRKDDNPYRH